jgi:hypothetical protein
VIIFGGLIGRSGQVKQAYCAVVDASTCSTLAQDCKSGALVRDGSYRTVMTALRDLRAIL